MDTRPGDRKSFLFPGDFSQTSPHFLQKSAKMKVYYDREVDALYITFGSHKPDGVTEASEGINLDTTSEGKIVGIEILDASKRMDLKTILSYELELDKENRESL